MRKKRSLANKSRVTKENSKLRDWRGKELRDWRGKELRDWRGNKGSKMRNQRGQEEDEGGVENKGGHYGELHLDQGEET